MKSLECDIYKSAKKEYLYLFVPADEGMARVPSELLAKFGEPEKTLTLTLTQEHVLAKENPLQVLRNLQQHGYHLQLPPADDYFV